MARREHISPAEFRAALAEISPAPLAGQRAHLAHGGSTERAIRIANRALTQSLGTLAVASSEHSLVTTLALPEAER